MALDGREREALNTVNTMTHMGGSCSLYYLEYRLRESLRKRGYLKFVTRRNQNWRYCFYDLTDKGRKELPR